MSDKIGNGEGLEIDGGDKAPKTKLTIDKIINYSYNNSVSLN